MRIKRTVPPWQWTIYLRVHDSPSLAMKNHPLRLVSSQNSLKCCFRFSIFLKTDFLGRYESPSSHFGRSWRPNCWDQVNFWGTPKQMGYYASNELCGRSVASKLIPQQAGGLFHQGDTEIGENLHFLIKRSTPENFQCDNFPGGGPMESLGDHASEYV